MNALLREYKDKYTNVFAADIKDQQFIFRELTRKEYKRIIEETDGYTLEEAICTTAVLYPEAYDFSFTGGAGISKTLAIEIISMSGFTNTEQQVEMLNHYRADMGNFESQAETVIQLVFPSVTEEQMENWTQEVLMKRLARAEWIMQTMWKMDYEFARQEVSEGEEQEAPTLKEIGAEIREQGGDPMVIMRDSILTKQDAGYVAFPIIGGTKLLKNEEVLNNVREQIQRLSKR